MPGVKKQVAGRAGKRSQELRLPSYPDIQYKTSGMKITAASFKIQLFHSIKRLP